MDGSQSHCSILVAFLILWSCLHFIGHFSNGFVFIRLCLICLYLINIIYEGTMAGYSISLEVSLMDFTFFGFDLVIRLDKCTI